MMSDNDSSSDSSSDSDWEFEVDTGQAPVVRHPESQRKPAAAVKAPETREQLAQKQQQQANWREWTACVTSLRPTGFRRLLEHGGIDPNRKVTFQDDRERSPDYSSYNDDGSPYFEEYYCYAPPLFLLELWAECLKRQKPPAAGPFHRFWKIRRQREMGLLPAAATPGNTSQGNQEGPEEILQSPQKKPRLAQGAVMPTASDEVSSADSEDKEDDEELQPSRLVPKLLELGNNFISFSHHRQPAKVEPLSPEEQRELAPLIPGSHELNAQELAEKVRDSKTQLIVELVLEDRVRTLLEFGANPNPDNFVRTHDRYMFSHPLAAESCPTSLLRLLLDAKADPNWSLRNGYPSALVFHRNSPEKLRLLLEAGADPDRTILSQSQPAGPITPIALPVKSPLFLEFLRKGVPEESLRTLLEFHPEICGLGSDKGAQEETPLSTLLRTSRRPSPLDLVLKLAYPFPANCTYCSADPGNWNVWYSCWENASGWTRKDHPPEHLQALIQVGYPVRGKIEKVIEPLLRSHSDGRPLGERGQQLLDTLRSVTEEGQAKRRQEHLGGFWSAIMKAVPSLSGVVASLVLQAIVPEFQLRIA